VAGVTITKASETAGTTTYHYQRKQAEQRYDQLKDS
jgi:hypothetical protein